MGYSKIAEQGCNILVTHVCPAIIPDEDQQREYVGDRNNIFYMTPDIDLVKESGADIVIFGHMHDVNEFQIDNVDFMINALGYPMEKASSGMKFFNYYLEEK